MGGKQSSISQQQLQVIESSHPQLRKVRVVHSQQGKTLLVQFALGNAHDLQKWQQEYKQVKDNQSLFIPLHYQIEKKFVCGQGGACKISYPFYQYLLSDYIQKFNQLDLLYQTQKIWYLLYQLCQTAFIFHSKGIKIGDVRPRNIFLNNSQRIKIGNRYSWPNQTTNYQISFYDKEVTYLAPQEIKELSFGHIEPQTNFQIAQCFSIGLTLLDRAILSDSASIYDLPFCRIDYQNLQQKFEKLRKLTHLDQLLKQVIEGLCRTDLKQRLNCRQIYHWLKQYKQDLVNKNKFQFKQIPSFLKTQAQVVKDNKPAIISKNMYVQSQVVSQFPGKFIHHQFNPTNLPPIIKNRQILIQNTYGPTSIPVSRPIQIAPPTNYQNSINTQDFNLTLKKIEQQLQRSRRMFPS